MAEISYQWNPWQDNIDNDIKGEVIKTEDVGDRVEFVPRAAPFFAHKFVLYKQGSETPLVLGTDYVFAHPFNNFIATYNRNVFGSVVLLKPQSDVLLADYSTIGGPFILDEIAYAELVANIQNSPRIVDWSDLSDVPSEFPPDPHDHPAIETYDYLDMMVLLQSLVLAMSGSNGGASFQSNLEEHIANPIPEAHEADPAAVGLGNVENLPPASIDDLSGNNPNAVITMDVLKEALRMFKNGELNLD